MRPLLKVRRRPGIEDLPLPRYMTEQSAGMDLYAANEEPITIAPGEIKLIPTGLYLEIPPGYEGQVQVEGSLLTRDGLAVEVPPTSQAVRRFNELRSADKRVTAVIRSTC